MFFLPWEAWWEAEVDSDADLACALPELPHRVHMDPKAGSKFTGFPNQSEAEADAPLDLTRRLIVHPAATFLMREGGHLLASIGILRGDFLVVDRS